MEVGELWGELPRNESGEVDGDGTGSFSRMDYGNITRRLPHRGAPYVHPWVGEFRVVMDCEGGRVH